MNLTNGFLFGLGFWLSLVGPLVLLVVVKKLKAKKASVATWKKYLDKVVAENDFLEAGFVKALIEGKAEDVMIRLPKNYKLKVDSKLTIDENGEKSLLDVEKTYTIEKVKK